MCSPEGGVSLSLLSRTCTVFGKADKKGGTALVSQWTRQYCKEAGVRRLPLTMGDGWCWSRMLSWLSQAVRVGAQCELKTIEAGVDAARGKQEVIEEEWFDYDPDDDRFYAWNLIKLKVRCRAEPEEVGKVLGVVVDSKLQELMVIEWYDGQILVELPDMIEFLVE